MTRPNVGWQTNRVLRFHAGPEILLGSKASRFWGQPSPLFESTGCAFFWWESHRGWKLVIHHSVMTRLRMSAALPLCPPMCVYGVNTDSFPISDTSQLSSLFIFFQGGWCFCLRRTKLRKTGRVYKRRRFVTGNVGLYNLTSFVSYLSTSCSFHILVKVTAVFSESGQVIKRYMT